MRQGLMVFLVLVTTLAMGGSGDVWTTASRRNARIVDERINKMLDRVSRKAFRDDQDQLRTIFIKTQKEFLHRYRQYASIDELADGNFDCLTATSLFAEILGRAGFNYWIMETNYHIFLMVSTSKGDVLIETTDRFQGFVTAPGAIARRIEGYRQEQPKDTGLKKAYEYSFNLYQEISSQQLAGLLYFNQAVAAYNDSKWVSCSEKIVAAENHCDSPRIAALASVLLCTVTMSNIPAGEKQAVIENLKMLENISGQAIALR